MGFKAIDPAVIALLEDVLAASVGPGIPGTVIPGSAWSLSNVSAAGGRAALTVAAPGPGKVVVVTSLTFSMAALAATTPAVVVARVTTSGGGTVLWQAKAKNLASDMETIAPSTLVLVGAVNSPVVVEFDVTSGVGVHQGVSAGGYLAQVT